LKKARPFSSLVILMRVKDDMLFLSNDMIRFSIEKRRSKNAVCQ
jgi:hypothetical protein